MAENLVRTEVISQIFGVSVRRVQQLTQDGVINTVADPAGGTRKYDLIPTVQKYIQYLSDKAYGKGKSERETQLKEDKLEAEVALKKSQSDLHNLRKEIAQGKYKSIEEIQLDYQKFFVVLKKFVLSIPNRISGIIAGYVDPVTVRALETDMAKEVASMLRTFVVAGYSKEDEAP